ncbi:hypothetical protein BC939DRAFT_447101 [Gamsiella multidivaricata]|uniref:uncharacterized protein n=1 Tax=Gamsiella multidivaricata TaxID=101098 RepID=UPI00221F2937|nr:uncharacterized protein BC939DRAFT_447101 [Gamsiella multidivaricata]KAI7826159.1 hypothetical protein BC939DRAFT_447101 [Gamsiella multidivaricata]
MPTPCLPPSVCTSLLQCLCSVFFFFLASTSNLNKRFMKTMTKTWRLFHPRVCHCNKSKRGPAPPSSPLGKEETVPLPLQWVSRWDPFFLRMYSITIRQIYCSSLLSPSPSLFTLYHTFGRLGHLSAINNNNNHFTF